MRTLLATDDVAHLRGRWLRLHYSQSFRGQPVRPLLRLTLSDGTTEEHILPAAAFGRARWIGWAPDDLIRLDLSADLPNARDFRLDAIRPCRTAPLLWEGLRRHPSGLVDLALWPWKGRRARRLSLQRLLDLEPLDRIAAFAAERTRPLEPGGLDAGLADAGAEIVLEFVVIPEPGELESLRETLASLASSRDVAGWRVRIAGIRGEAVAAIMRAAGLKPAPPHHFGAAQPNPEPIDADAGQVRGPDVAGPPPSPAFMGSGFSLREPRNDDAGGIPALSAAAASPARFVALLRPGDRLRPEALPILIDTLARERELRLLYADSVLTDASGRLIAPELKPDWSPDFLAQADYIGRPSLIRTDILHAILGEIAFDDPHPWRRAVQVAGAAGDPDGVRHLRRVLLHRRNADALPSPLREDHRTRIEARHPDPSRPASPGLEGRAESAKPNRGGGSPAGAPPPSGASHLPPPPEGGGSSGGYRMRWPSRDREGEGAPASIVIPTKNRVELLRRAVDSIHRLTPAGSYELVIVDNGSDAPDALAYLATLPASLDIVVLNEPGPFNFSRLVNRGVAAARHPVVVLLNNDCEILHPGWLARLSAIAARPGIGAVGARLLYADGTLQHAGIGIGLGGFAGHRDRGEPRDHPGHLARLRVPHEVSAVTAACLAVTRETYLAAGGFDEGFAVAFNDVDFCLRLESRGLRNILADVELRHAESASRGRDAGGAKRARFEEEAARFAERWRPWMQADPYTHPLFAVDRFSDRLG